MENNVLFHAFFLSYVKFLNCQWLKFGIPQIVTIKYILCRAIISPCFQKCGYYFTTVCIHSLLWSRSFWRFLENAWMCNNIKMQWISTSIHQSLEIHSLEKRSIKARRRKWRFVKLFWFQHYSWLLLTKPMHPQDVI